MLRNIPSSNEKIELKACPFCGKDVAVFRDCQQLEVCTQKGRCSIRTPNFAVCCNFNEGGCGACGGFRGTAAKAAEAWNGRHAE